MHSKTIGRPLSPVTARLLKAINKAGASGMSTADIYAAFPANKSTARHAALNMVCRGQAVNRRHGRLTVYYPTTASPNEVAENFAQRVADYKEHQRQLGLIRSSRYYARQVEAAKNRRGIKATQEADRAARRALVAKLAAEDREARKRLQAEQRKKRAEATAARKAETALNNRLAQRIRGTSRGIVPVPPAPVANEDWSKAHVTVAAPKLGRYEVLDAPRMFSALPVGRYLEAA